MSGCRYYKINKGKAKCTNPSKPEYGRLTAKDLAYRCDRCRRECRGIWPSQLPKVDLTGENIDIIDNNGNIIVSDI